MTGCWTTANMIAIGAAFFIFGLLARRLFSEDKR